MDYEKYRKARNASWDILLDCKVESLPIDMKSILKQLNIGVLKYCDNLDFIRLNGYDELVKKSDGFAVCIQGRYFIFYNDKCIPTRKRYILAHELGHIVLNHFSSEANHCENQANVFASRLLAPAFILHELKLFNIESIVEECRVSREFANIRLERILDLEERNNKSIETKGYSCFYLSKEEKKLKKQFSTYLQEKKIK